MLKGKETYYTGLSEYLLSTTELESKYMFNVVLPFLLSSVILNRAYGKILCGSKLRNIGAASAILSFAL